MHHAHRILHRHRLRTAGLQIDLGAAEAGQDQRLAAGDDVGPVELGGHVHGEVGPPHGVLGHVGVGHG